jgi:tetraacyldisaccharide 4'-kinase
MRARWLLRRDESPLVAVLLALPAWVYGAGARLHRALYERGWRRRARLGCKVVSVGNLGVGGSGKTPTAAWLAAALAGRGRKVALATRGFARRGREPVCVVSDGQRVLASVAEAGDEPLLLAAHAPGVPVVVGRDRAQAGLRAQAAFAAEVLVLDDGFQHHRLARDVEVLVVDGGLGFGNRRLLPRGPLREPLALLARAHALGVVDGPLPPEDEALAAARAPAAFRFEARRRPAGLWPLGGGGAGEPAESLAGRRVGLLSGIANPATLRHSVEALGARVVAERAFGDHHRYRARDLAGLSVDASLWVTTEKDALKILPRWAGEADLRVLRIELEVADPERLLAWLESRLR